MTGEQLKECRLKLQMTLQEVADVIGVSRQTIRNYETNFCCNVHKRKYDALINFYKSAKPQHKERRFKKLKLETIEELENRLVQLKHIETINNELYIIKQQEYKTSWSYL